jgi:MFS family permease
MISKFAQQLGTGIKEGIRTSNFSFFGICAMALGIPPLMLAMLCTYTAQPLSWRLMEEIAVPFCFSVVFSLYMVVIKALQVFHQHKGNEALLPKLIKQFDSVVFVVMIVLIASLMIR